MDYEIVELPARTVVGPTVRASNNSSGEGAVIGQLWARFLGEGLDRSIPGTRVEPYGCFALYYGYDPVPDENYRDIQDFFRAYKAFVHELTPTKPVALAPNNIHMHWYREQWRGILQNVDILIPFAFAIVM